MAKRLKRNKKGSIILPSGERITPKEQKEFRKLVERANYRREQEFNALPDIAKQKHREFGKDQEFYIRKKSKGFSKFESRADFNRYKKTLRRITTGQFKKKNLETKYSNYVRALYTTFNSEADELMDVIGELSEEELSEFIDAEELEDTGYVYHDVKSTKAKKEHIVEQVNKIRTKLKAKKRL